MSEDAARARVESWLAPISDAAPAGEDARYEPLHEEIRNEVAKLDSPTSGLPDWAKVATDADKLTTSMAKDLVIESYAAYALYQTEGMLGLAAGLFLLAESMDRFWDVMHPKAKRIRARVNAVDWLTARLDTTLPETQVGASDGPALAALEAGVKRLRAVVAEKFEDQAPALRPLADAVERLKMSLPEGAADAAVDAGPDTEPPPPPDAAPADASPPAPAEAPAPAPAAAAEPAPADDKPSADDHIATLTAAAAEYVAPIPGDSPAGADAKYEMSHEELRNDIAALDTPNGGDLDWVNVIPRAGAILTNTSKDYLIASYLAFALWETKELEGLAIGLEVLTQITERYWDDCFPPAKRIRGRANALAWLLNRIEEPLPDVTLTAESGPAVELLEVAVKRFATAVREKFEDAAPSIRPLQQNVERLKLSVPEPAPKAPPTPPPAPKAAASAPTPARAQAKPAASAAAVSLEGGDASLADPKEITKFSRGVSTSIVNAAKMLREAAPADPTSYQFLRLALALGQKSPEAKGGKTMVPGPKEDTRRDLDRLLADEAWDKLLVRAEGAFNGKRFWFDPHRYSALALQNLGKDYSGARDAVIAGCAFWATQFSDALEMTFADGTPFASDLTREWIGSEVLPGGDGGGGGADGEGAEVLSAARGLAGTGKLDEALAALEGLAHNARSGRARFRGKLAIAALLTKPDTAAVAVGIFEALAIEAEALSSWEPELAAECHRLHLAALKQQKKQDPAAIAVAFRRLCAVDPLAAARVGG